MDKITYEPNDRRPIAARGLPIMSRFSTALTRSGVRANTVSTLGMVCGLLAGLSLWYSSSKTGGGVWVLWIGAAVLIQLRLLANLLDGMVAIASGTASRLGELFNEVPDRVSDSAIFLGMGYALGGEPVLGWAAALLSVLTAYVRVLGKALTGVSDYRGPMAKQHRMFLITVACIACSMLGPDSQARNLPAYVLGIICVGCVVTSIRRLLGIASALKRAA